MEIETFLRPGLIDTNPLPTAQPETEMENSFGIRIGSLGFLISTATYCEVLDKIQISSLPNVHPWISGLLNLRGNLVPVFDLHRALEEQAADLKKRRLFVIDRGDKAAALWIDNLPEIKTGASLLALKKLPLLPENLQRFVTKGYEQDGQIWLKLKFEDFFKLLGNHQYAMEEMVT